MTRICIFIFFSCCVVAEVFYSFISEASPELYIFTAVFSLSLIPLICSKFFKEGSDEKANKNSIITTTLSIILISILLVSFVISAGYYDDLNMFSVLQNGNRIEAIDSIWFSISEAIGVMKDWLTYCFLFTFWAFVAMTVKFLFEAIGDSLSKFVGGDYCHEYRTYSFVFSCSIMWYLSVVALFCNAFDDITERKVYRVDIKIEEELLPYMSDKCGRTKHIRYHNGLISCDFKNLTAKNDITSTKLFENKLNSVLIEMFYATELHFVWESELVDGYQSYLSLPKLSAPPLSEPDEYLLAIKEAFSESVNEIKDTIKAEQDKEFYDSQWNNMAIN